MGMSVLRFILLAIRPVGKLESAIGWLDGINLLVWLAYSIIPRIPVIDLSEWQTLAWFAGIPAVLFLVAGIKLQFKVDNYEKRLPKLEYRLLPFPQGGTRIISQGEDELEEGYAKIAIRNNGGKVEDCYGIVCGIALVDERKEILRVIPLKLTNENLYWDGNGKYMTIVNDSLERYVNIAYLDQNKPRIWKLAIKGNQKKDYSLGWWKIDIVISSLKTQMEPVNIEVALGLGERERPASGINLWPWDKWYEARQRELKQVLGKEGSQS